MAKSAVQFKIADVSRALKGAAKGGMKIGRAEIDPATGRIIVVAAGEAAESQSALDRWMEADNARAP
ncbi:MAG: hypothetical protein EOS63_07920 [Mesorhizobium sp.]|uniref:hypothetical protein n=1 Tax=Mesorhizobium sp. TaxID=1871066 RepID=UPI000FE6F5CE|nr:hypothetical protein [Mesorhizobium sp.]RWE81905.1 MAG: hypothetical protein EOS63_07920 [Mesorhizobium sp.]TJW62311.1 MAG: hypothetical protein E5V97_17460 [Mesorhizobium sp.]